MSCRRSNPKLRAAIEHHCLDTEHADIEVTRLTQRPYLKYVKRPLELMLASIALIAFTPLVPLIAAAIKLDSAGPVLFRQHRTGYLGRRFVIIKFRTMIRDAEARKAQLQGLTIHGNQSPDFKVRDDPRVTRVGRFLRRTSLDEVPNLINVLRGEMALVGPRPTSFPATTYAPHQLARLAVRPGVTGLWQVCGRSDLDFCDRTRLDIEYIERVSLWFDLRILLRTLLQGSRGAY